VLPGSKTRKRIPKYAEPVAIKRENAGRYQTSIWIREWIFYLKNNMRKFVMIDNDNEEVRWWMGEVEQIVCELQSSWKEVTVESLTRELFDRYELSGTAKSEELLEMCEDYLKRYNDPFDGLGNVPSALKFLTESGKNAALKAISAKSKLLKSQASELDAYIKDKFGDSMTNLSR
jgi:hypothetical protein